ncbi:nucleotide-diphospho-sugar transferase [Truncatella angustata]|uniref:glycogenin glucosyltransferase n=1 Tax=Truncatella angustata TaxID=152316 RepID=A0A9P8UNP8_9PEZI|nr:nucleotide-diphospho-sugar transferase [Truncatella angustata]KAH6655264.1 nucleotide-diphospho-sugar transferase [Truncatella angustata]
MAVQGAEDVYLTLLLTDTYLPGALVLAHSLRDSGTTKKLGVLVTLDSVAAEVITQLKTVYDYVIPVPRIKNAFPANLSLMNRTDLASAFTKINLWKQTSFRKIVYLDADVVAYRAPDELFDLPHAFSAAPDIGWPDIFNTGVMVLTPNMGDYYALSAMAERGISFDGADQGLLNMYFKNTYNRLSFTYNVTPSGHYQYIPAYRHFQSSINMVHFIGTDKPWYQGRSASAGSGPYDEMIGRWWAVYDRHYRAEDTAATPQIELVQYLTKGEYQPPQPRVTNIEHGKSTGEHYDEHGDDQAPQSNYPQQDGHQAQSGATTQSHEQFPSTSSFSSSTVEGTQAEARAEQVPQQQYHPEAPPPPPEEKKPERPPVTFSDWDAQRHPPPADSKPEAANFPAISYEMSKETAPFVPPERYPSPPKDMWYKVPEQPPTYRVEKPKSIFPWETSQPRPTRVFADDSSQTQETETEKSSTPTGEPRASAPFESQPPTETTFIEHSGAEQKEPVTPATPTIHITPSDPWTAFTRTNAWDEVPAIERYVDKMQSHRRTRSLKSPGKIDLSGPGGAVAERDFAQTRRGSRVTDFPSEAERPSLPVTPAPIRRPKFWGGGGPGIGDGDDDDPLLPAAEGVPGQSEWVCVHGRWWKPTDCLCDLTNVLRHHKDPVAQLQKLAKQQSEALLQKLGDHTHDSDDLPSRSVPFGSEDLTSPTYMARSPQVLSPQPVKGSASSSIVRSIVSEEPAKPRDSNRTSDTATSDTVLKPSYSGPGSEFEKGEDFSKHSTPLPPSENELDVLNS